MQEHWDQQQTGWIDNDPNKRRVMALTRQVLKKGIQSEPMKDFRQKD